MFEEKNAKKRPKHRKKFCKTFCIHLFFIEMFKNVHEGNEMRARITLMHSISHEQLLHFSDYLLWKSGEMHYFAIRVNTNCCGAKSGKFMFWIPWDMSS
jgi:hypothetical protein